MVEERINERNLPAVLIVVSLRFAPAYYYHLVAPLFKRMTQSRSIPVSTKHTSRTGDERVRVPLL